MDNAIVGLEVKFFAPFQPGQPCKYLETISKKADVLGPLRSADRFDYVVFVLVPDSIESGVKKHLSTVGDTEIGILTWMD